MPETLPFPATPDLPEFAVKVGGAEVEPALREDVLRIEVHEEVGKLARASVLVRNWNEEAQEVTHSEAGVFAPGAEVELQLGYNGELETVFEGVVVGLKGSFTAARPPTLEVDCRCKGALLLGGRRTRVFEESTDGDVVSAIAGEAGLDADAETGAEQPFAVQRSQTDWEYLSERARRLGMALYVRGGTLVFKPPAASAASALTLEWTGNVLELELERGLLGRPDAAVASSWDAEALEAAEGEAAADDAGVATGDRPALGADVGDSGFPNRDERLPRPGAEGPDELGLVALGRLRAAALAHGSGRGRIAGLPALRIDSVVEIERAGAQLGGSYYVGAVRHVLDRSGYTTEFQLGLPDPLRPGPADAGRAEGLFLGVVDDIDDPNGWGRVRVRLPWLDPDVDSLWARLARPDAGPDRGFFFIPEVGDEVVCGALGGDLRYPIVLGLLWNGTQAPPEELDAQTNDVRAVVTRAGHKLTFDDGDSAPLVQVETAGGQSITLDDTSGSEKIEVADKTGNTLTMESSGVTLEAVGDLTLKAGGKLALEGVQLEAKGSGTAKVESSGTLDLQASATLGIKGALVNINA